MKVEVKAEAGYYSVYVDGQRTVDRESYTVANHVAEALKGCPCGRYAESHEVAAAILKWKRG